MNNVHALYKSDILKLRNEDNKRTYPIHPLPI
jgi:hypothetical protein